MEQLNVGFALCGSFCTLERAVEALERAAARYSAVWPILSGITGSTDTRFGSAGEFVRRIEAACGRPVISTVAQAEPIGPKKLLDALVICPCTGNTLAKLACGITDTPLLMAVKAHLRNGRPVVLALSTNDALGASAQNIGRLLTRRDIYFVPFSQDDPEKKPRSMAAHFGLCEEALDAALEGRQLQPIIP